MRTIRGFLVWWLLVGLGVLGGVGGYLIFQTTRERLVEEFDRVLKAKGRALGTQLERCGDWIEVKLAPGGLPEFEGGENPEYYQIWLADRRLIKRSDTLGRQDLPFRFDRTGKAESFDHLLPDGRRGRAVGVVVGVARDEWDDPDDEPHPQAATTKTALPNPPAGREIAIIVIAKGRETLDGAIMEVRRTMLWVALAMGIGVVLLVTFTTKRGLRALDVLARRAATIDARSLALRMPVDGQPREVRDLTAKLNELLERLEQAFERERRMTTNIAHELRTPVAELALAADVAAKWIDDPHMVAGLVAATKDVSKRMHRIVAGLLHLARIESGRESVESRPVRLEETVGQAWSTLRVQAAARGVHFESDGGEAPLRSDPSLLAIAVANLLENAVTHSPANARIRSKIERDSGGVRWTLSNPANGLTTADLDRMAEPFWCKNPSRTDHDHVGLGVAFAKSLVDLLGGRLGFELLDSELSVVMSFAAGGSSGMARP